MTTKRAALVLGATGGIGGEMARTLRRRGWHVRALHRRAAEMAGRDGLDWRQGDAMAAETVARAAEGVDLIVHAVNPPGYRDWDKLVLPMLESSIGAADANGARILLPGTLYNFGPEALPLVTEESPQNPLTRKGRIRVEMERRLRAAADRGVPVLIVRAGDFFGPGAANNWFSQGMVKPGKALAAITNPAAPGVGHQWAYLPDVAETMARLLEADDLERFAVYHMEGHWDPTGSAMVTAIREAAGRPDLPVRRFPWILARLAAPAVPLFREIVEMRHLWQKPMRMPNDKLVAKIGPEPRTPLVDAVQPWSPSDVSPRRPPRRRLQPEPRSPHGLAPLKGSSGPVTNSRSRRLQRTPGQKGPPPMHRTILCASGIAIAALPGAATGPRRVACSGGSRGPGPAAASRPGPVASNVRLNASRA